VAGRDLNVDSVNSRAKYHYTTLPRYCRRQVSATVSSCEVMVEGLKRLIIGDNKYKIAPLLVIHNSGVRRMQELF
jgi:hypothetical protein